ncbi:hypothetical protein [Methylovorus sp. MP688]|uniref:hypothetical protein n=1 Tax=Methylovorus sp. (strain MP688) TaxID=887061 RepID=UPI0001EC4C9F|nr:hypothetical protein [Methylovorus sp. MP688]ADQ85505.1 hypothetical protein MPQ_2360 [Methylovorus sp. MP688]
MKIIFRFFVFGLLCLSLTSNAAVSSSFSQDQQELIKLIQQFYAIPTTTYLFANFNNKYHPELHCPFLSKFLAKEALVKRKDGVCFQPIRYPTMDGEDAILSSDYPIPKIQTPVVKGSLAEVLVLFKNDPGRVRFYLKNTPDGWRIHKSRSDTSADIPENTQNPDDMRALMFTYFPPSADEVEDENRRLFPE